MLDGTEALCFAFPTASAAGTSSSRPSLSVPVSGGPLSLVRSSNLSHRSTHQDLLGTQTDAGLSLLKPARESCAVPLPIVLQHLSLHTATAFVSATSSLPPESTECVASDGEVTGSNPSYSLFFLFVVFCLFECPALSAATKLELPSLARDCGCCLLFFCWFATRIVRRWLLCG